jgi:hydroxymethylpyrimidine pyrophosphatase-like HAD family hydrolase
MKSENWVGRIEVTTCEGPHPTSATATRKVPSSEAIGRHALKVVVSVKPNGNELMANLVRTSAELQHLSGVQSESGRWEFTAAGATKLAGVERIINRYGYSGDDCIAFGNSFNDEQVLAWAGRSIGVEPIPETVRAVVDKTVSTIDEVAQHLLI